MQKIFFGRTQYLDLIEKRASGLKDGYRQNICLVGDELVGKTSLVLRCIRNLSDAGFVKIYLDIRHEPLQIFGRRFIGCMLYDLLRTADTALKEDLDFLIEKASSVIPQTVSRIKVILADIDRRKKDNIFGQLLSLCDLIHQETGRCCIVIFDEFQNLESLNIKTLYKDWSQVLITQKNSMYILLSSAPYKAHAILSENLNLLFGNFEVINVEPFDIKEADRYLDTRLIPNALPAAARNFIINFTGGYPFYLDLLCDAVRSTPHPDLVQILENMLFTPSGILNQRFQNYLKRFGQNQYAQDYTGILHLVACGHNKIKDIAHILKKPKTLISSRVSYLLEADALARCGDFLKINDRVLCFWLKFVHQAKQESLTFDAQNQAKALRASIEAMIHEFAASAGKKLPERVVEMMRMFGDDRIQLEKKSVRLTHFREIKPVEFSRQPKDGLVCRSGDSLWVIGFKQDALSEDDIAAFSQECKKFKHKLERKVLVTLSDIDQNSRLRALEEKILTWDINCLNQMFDLFSKPRIIA
ncbi:MAG: ATP-binding protein [Candidatus Omnitrophica bacterium]|nr:ATP-binding protein [Candidatus Omnitrophota bacterium]